MDKKGVSISGGGFDGHPIRRLKVLSMAAYLPLVRLLVIVLLLLLTACSSTSGFVGRTSLVSLEALEQPAEKILLLYQHGSQPENVKDPCNPLSTFLPGRVPDVIAQLSGSQIENREVVVYALCSKVPGRFGGYPQSELKVRMRANEIKKLLHQVQLLGVPSEQVFLVGYSAGAWASLLVAKDSPELFNSVVGFAPAFAGQKALRSERWEGYFELQREELLDASEISALLYAFENDAFYDLEDLRPLESINQLTLLWPDDNPCLRGHGAVFRPCFTQQASERIRDYIGRQLQKEH